MVEERIQALLNNVKDQCPNIGPVPCFIDETRAILQIHFRYDSDPIPDHSDEEDDDEYMMTRDHGYNHMFLHALDLQESDWSAHEKDIIERYQRYMKDQG